MRRLAFNLVGVSILLAQVTACAAAVAGLVLALGQPHLWRWYHWVILSPGLYLSWLVLFLALSAAICRELGSRYPKPRYLAVHPGAGRIGREELGLVTTTALYRRLAIVHQLAVGTAGRSACRRGPVAGWRRGC